MFPISLGFVSEGISSIMLLVYLSLKSAKITLAPNDFDGLDEVIAPTDYTFKCLEV